MDATLVALRALAEPHRLAIVRALRERERCVRDLVAVVGAPQPLVSHHLARLVAAGLVSSRHGDGFTYYALRADGLSGAQDLVAGLLDADLPAEALPGGGVGCCR